jgi:thioesterase domain-containing protein
LKNLVYSADRYAYVSSLLRAKILRIKYRLFESPDRLAPQKIGALEEVNGYAAANYHPKRYPGKLTLFRSTKRAVQQGNDDYLGWGEFAGGGAEVHHVPGTHFNILQEPEVRVVAEKLRSCLESEIVNKP